MPRFGAVLPAGRKKEGCKLMNTESIGAGSGGIAAQRGISFQNRAAAWVAVRILAEQSASPLWGLGHQVTLDYIGCETEHPIDDIFIVTSNRDFIFVQVKHTLQLTTGSDSALASAIDQFVRQFLISQDGPAGGTLRRLLDAERDRFVLLVGPESSAPIREVLPRVLRMIRSLQAGQRLDTLTLNRKEKRVAGVIQAHIATSWERHRSPRPSDEHFRALLSMVRIQVLDVDEGGSGEREARDLLRSSVLHDHLRDDQAWSALVQTCGSFASTRTGGDRAALQHTLIDSGIPVREPRSYRDDIQQLRAHSRKAVIELADLSRIRVGSDEVKIRRQSTDALLDAVESGSLVVVGGPGAGKTGALHDLGESLVDGGRDMIFLSVDRLGAESASALRDELLISHELVDTLVNWHGPGPAFLIIDALDAARSDRQVKTLRDLIAQTSRMTSRWTIVASIRKFDLRYNREIGQLFVGTPPTPFLDTDFANVRHINIPKFDREELDQIPAQSRDLGKLVDKPGSELYEMLRVPFNLRLLAELLGMGIAFHDLTPIRTQTQLLDLYWSYRVTQGQLGDAREVVLRRACEEMVRARTLRVDRALVTDGDSRAILTDMLSSQILVEWRPSPTAMPNRYILGFAHHVLYDLAVARLVLSGEPTALVDRLEREPEIVLAIRPSLVLHFRHTWFSDSAHAAFWQLVQRIIQSDDIPEIGKLIGPVVAAELTAEFRDMAPLLTELQSPDGDASLAAECALGHVVGALLAAPAESGRQLVGPGAGPWCELVEYISRDMRMTIAQPVRMLLRSICEHPDVLTPEQRGSCGEAARRLLGFAWNLPRRDSWLVIHALQAVCRTIESDPTDSAELVRRFLEPEHITEYGHEELQWLAREIQWLIPHEPQLVEDTYRAAFKYREQSDSTTSMTSSRIIAMTSTRRQDYDMALYGLAEQFPNYLSQAPIHALRALIAAMDAYVAQRHELQAQEPFEEPFEFGDQQARIRTDYSCVWDSGDSYRHDSAIKMLDAFKVYLIRVAQHRDNADLRRRMLDELVAHNQLAVLWKTFISCGIQAVDTLGMDLLPLAWTVSVLTCVDTTNHMGELLKGVFHRSDLEQRRRIEKAILSIPDTAPRGVPESRGRWRDRLLGCLRPDALVTREAKTIVDELAHSDGFPSNRLPPPAVEVSWEGTYGEREFLADEGVDVDEESNRRIQALEKPVKEFADRHQNSPPTITEMEASLPELRSLGAELEGADHHGIHPKQLDYAWGCLAEACERIAACEQLSCEDEAGSFARRILLKASAHRIPVHRPAYDAQFDDSLSWGARSPRISAAQGLTCLARAETYVNAVLLTRIEELTRDPVPAVRFQVALRLALLDNTAPDIMWKLLEQFSDREVSRGVISGLLSEPLRRLSGQYPDRIVRLAKTIYDRFEDDPGAKRIREYCISILLRRYLIGNDPLCRDIVHGIAEDPYQWGAEARRIVVNLRDFLTYGPVQPRDSSQAEVRQRSFALMRLVLWSTCEAIRKLTSDQRGILPATSTPDELEQARALFQLAESIAMQLYFASGAFDAERSEKGEVVDILDTERRRRFLEEAGPLIEKLADLGLANIAHLLVKTLQSLVPLDPSAVFVHVGRVVFAGRQDYFEYESLAAKLIASLVERYLAEFRVIFRDNPGHQGTLLEILDTFVKAGWPSAHRLTYRLEEMFR